MSVGAPIFRLCFKGANSGFPDVSQSFNDNRLSLIYRVHTFEISPYYAGYGNDMKKAPMLSMATKPLIIGFVSISPFSVKIS